MDILIKNVTIVTDEDIIDEGYILIKDQIIKDIGSGQYENKNKDIRVIDGKGHCAIPGLVNCHTHAAMTMLRGYGEGLPLMRWLNEKIWPMESKFKEKHIIMGTKLAAIEMLRTGTTTFNDMYFMQENVFQVCQQLNMRTVLGIPLIGDAWQVQLKAAMELSNYIDKYDNKKLVKSMLAPHSPYTLSTSALTEIAVAAKVYNKNIHIHIAETEDEINIIKDRDGKTPCELLLDTGIFDNKVVGAHCVHLSDDDINILKRKDISPVYNPQSNMKLASGVSRMYEMYEKGINVCIGTDGCSSNNNLNMFEEMKTGSLLQKLWYKDATVMDGRVMMKMATENGAKALGYENLGKLKKGFLADVVLLNMNTANMCPTYDLHSNLVFSASGNEVDTVIVNGEIVMDKGQFVSIDEEKIIFEADKLCKELV